MFEVNTQNTRLIRGKENEKGWRSLEISDGEEIAGPSPTAQSKTLLSLIQLSDLHLCDSQSPARLEVLDRFADPHNPTSEKIKLVGNYRAQEIMTAQTLDCMVNTINGIEMSPITGRKIDAVVITGDVIDNAQKNELNWYKTILDGGEVIPNSGNPDFWEGAASLTPDRYDRSYWNPEGTPQSCQDDYPRQLYGFPTIPGLLKAVTNKFLAKGLKHNWLAIHGNHDAMLQGTVPPDEYLREFAVGKNRVHALLPEIDLQEIFSDYQMVGPANYPPPSVAEMVEITPDRNRDFITTKDWIEAHLNCGHDHGLTDENQKNLTKYWRKDFGDIAIIAMDTVNHHGGWQGSVDLEQFNWIKNQLSDTTPRYFVFLSHHPAETLFNDYAPEGTTPRICENELVEALVGDERVILWLAGHTHSHKIEERVSKNGRGKFWHIQTSSNVDWPQQGRVIDVIEDGGRIIIATVVLNHNGEIDLTTAISNLNDNKNLAGISRILSANDWQRRSGEFDIEKLAGTPEDRNIYLWI